MTDALQSEVWLLKSRTNTFPVKGDMKLADGQVQVTVTGGADCIASIREYLEEQSGIAGLAARLEQGEPVVVLQFAAADAEVSFPTTSGGYIAKVDVAGKTWYVALAYPAGGAITNVMSMRTGRKLAKQWKAALAG
jgi:hypothetical protein